MRPLLLFMAVVTHAAVGFCQAPTNSMETLMHTETAFGLIVHLPYAEAAPLFGPEGERAWAGKHWDPQFIYPKPARDVEGAVFTVKHEAFSAVWVNTVFDVEARHFQYVYFIPESPPSMYDSSRAMKGPRRSMWCMRAPRLHLMGMNMWSR